MHFVRLESKKEDTCRYKTLIGHCGCILVATSILGLFILPNERKTPDNSGEDLEGPQSSAESEGLETDFDNIGITPVDVQKDSIESLHQFERDSAEAEPQSPPKGKNLTCASM